MNTIEKLSVINADGTISEIQLGGMGSSTFTHREPRNEGMRNSLKRMRQLTDMKWTPQADLPDAYYDEGENWGDLGERKLKTFKAGVELTGAPYSSAKDPMHYFGFNISYDTFISSLQDTNSKMYTGSIPNLGNNFSTYYGTVCSAFASTALDIKGICNSYSFPYIDGLEKIADYGYYDEYDLELCDVLVTPGHVAMISDIITDETGKITFIEVSEATCHTTALCRRTLMTPERYFKWYDVFDIYRYKYLDKTTYNHNENIPLQGEVNCFYNIKYACLPTNGTKYNYRPNQSIEIHILEEGYVTLRVLKDGKKLKDYSISGLTTITVPNSGKGYYKAYLINAAGNRSVACDWAVVDAKVTYERQGDQVIVSYDALGDLLALQFGTMSDHVWSDYNGGAVDIPKSKLGSTGVRAIFKSRFGIYDTDWSTYTIPSYKVSLSLGLGATSDNSTTSLEKNSSYTTTITLNDEYELDTSTGGAMVYMGGTSVPNVISVSGKTITVTIPTVTGNIIISIPTKNITTGKRSVPIAQLLTWNLGKSVDGNGQEASNNLWATTNMLDVSNYTNPTLVFTNLQSYGISQNCSCYDDNEQFIERIVENKDDENPHTHTLVTNTAYIRITMGHPSVLGVTTAMTQEEIALFDGIIVEN